MSEHLLPTTVVGRSFGAMRSSSKVYSLSPLAGTRLLALRAPDDRSHFAEMPPPDRPSAGHPPHSSLRSRGRDNKDLRLFIPPPRGEGGTS